MNLLDQCLPYLERQTKYVEELPENNVKWLEHYERKGGYFELRGEIDEAIQYYEKGIEYVDKYGD